MRAGQLRFTIVIESKSVTADAYGGTGTWTTFESVRANVKYLGGSEGYKNQQELSENKVIFTIRKRSDLNPDMRIVFESDTYTIENIKPIGRFRDGLEIVGKLVE